MGKGTKTGLFVAGAAVAGASLILLNSNARKKVKNASITVKDNVSKYAQTIKEDPQGSKDAIVQRIQNATNISKEKLSKMQHTLEQQVTNLKQSAKTDVDEVKQDASDELIETKDAVKEVKEEIEAVKEDLQPDQLANQLHQTDNNTITNRPTN